MFEISIPTIMILIVDKGIDSGNVPYILKIGGLMLLMAVLGSYIFFYMSVLCIYSISRIWTNLRDALFKKIGTLSYNEIDEFGNSFSN